ncbi:MAG: hypothetical protein RIA69_06520 [Cyclobacteriaceae bacterium]
MRIRTNRPKINGFLLWLLVPKSAREMALVKPPGLVISTLSLTCQETVLVTTDFNMEIWGGKIGV